MNSTFTSEVVECDKKRKSILEEKICEFNSNFQLFNVTDVK